MCNSVLYKYLYTDLFFSVACAVSVNLHSIAGLSVNLTQSVESNSTAVIVCNINVEYPSWSGPSLSTHDWTTYNYNNHPDFNPFLSQDKLQRMSWADNKRDLVLNPVTREDDGDYYCSYAGMMWFVKFDVRGICI